jgi:hypothetical protein
MGEFMIWREHSHFDRVVVLKIRVRQAGSDGSLFWNGRAIDPSRGGRGVEIAEIAEFAPVRGGLILQTLQFQHHPPAG